MSLYNAETADLVDRAFVAAEVQAALARDAELQQQQPVERPREQQAARLFAPIAVGQLAHILY